MNTDNNNKKWCIPISSFCIVHCVKLLLVANASFVSWEHFFSSQQTRNTTVTHYTFGLAVSQHDDHDISATSRHNSNNILHPAHALCVMHIYGCMMLIVIIAFINAFILFLFLIQLRRQLVVSINISSTSINQRIRMGMYVSTNFTLDELNMAHGDGEKLVQCERSERRKAKDTYGWCTHIKQ